VSKVIVSPVKRWPGEVILSDPLTLAQDIAFMDAMEAGREHGENYASVHLRAAILPGILACVEEWKLEGLPTPPTIENFPATPMTSSARLIVWLWEEIANLHLEAEEVPNE